MNRCLLLFFLIGCATSSPDPTNSIGLIIDEKHPNKETAMVKQNLFHLAQVYDLRPFLYTKRIIIDPNVISHSHPVLTLNTRFAEYPHKLLSLWLHEELHWWMVEKGPEVKAAIKELKKIYPHMPRPSKILPPDSGHLHLIVCYLEVRAMQFYLGEKEAKKIIQQFIRKDKLYPWIYYQILHKPFPIKRIVERFKLLPPPLS